MWNVDRPLRNLPDVWTFISTCGLCVMSNSLPAFVKCLTALHDLPDMSRLIRSCGLCTIFAKSAGNGTHKFKFDYHECKPLGVDGLERTDNEE